MERDPAVTSIANFIATDDEDSDMVLAMAVRRSIAISTQILWTGALSCCWSESSETQSLPVFLSPMNARQSSAFIDEGIISIVRHGYRESIPKTDNGRKSL